MLQEKFKRELVHASKFKSPKENARKRVLVFGAGTSGHDIAWEHVKRGVGEHLLKKLTSNTSSENFLATTEVVIVPNARHTEPTSPDRAHA